jgi:succinyl-diaminopimelate desuccinylase
MPDLEATVDAVLAAVDDAYTLDLARRLVRTPSVFRPGDLQANEAAVAALLAEELRHLGLEVHREEVAPGRPNVIGDWIGQATGPVLILEGHSDVVTEGDASAWTVPPFGGVVADGRLYGRGAADMKGGVAAAVASVRAIRDAGVTLPGRIRVAVVADEEGMMLGIKGFIRSGWARDACGAIICEPEGNDPCLVQKGALRVVVRFRGKMAHGAMPRSGVNPIPPAAAFVQRLQTLQAEYTARHGRHPLLGEPTLTPTILRAGEPAQFNVIHDSALVGIDVRTIPGQTHEEICRDLAAAAADAVGSVPGCQSEVEVIEERPWTETPRDAPIVQAVERACRRARGQPPRHRGVPGATDGTFLHTWGRVPIVTIGPGDVMMPHQVDEFVRVADLGEACRIFAASACYCLGNAHLSSGDASPLRGHVSR